MNERIKELAEQAEIYAEQNTEHWKPGPDWDELFRKKFAELIVRECIDTAFHKGHPDLEFLLKHFGVEQ
jgi:hypothetical protein